MTRSPGSRTGNPFTAAHISMQSTARWVVTRRPSCRCWSMASGSRSGVSASHWHTLGASLHPHHPSVLVEVLPRPQGEGATTSSASASLFRSRNQPTISGKLGWRNCQLRFLCLFWGSEGCCCVPLEKASWVQGTSDWPWARLVFLHWGAAPPCGVPHFLGGPHHRQDF